MKITIESNDNKDICITLNWQGRDYTEKWENEIFCKKSIVAQMEQQGINAKGTIIEDVIDNLDLVQISELIENENTFK